MKLVLVSVCFRGVRTSFFCRGEVQADGRTVIPRVAIEAVAGPVPDGATVTW